MNEHEERREKTSSDVPAEVNENDPKTVEGSRRQNRRMLLWGVCAVYLLYLVYGMVQDLRAGGVDSSTSRVVVIAACVVFAGAAVAMLVAVVRTALRSFRASVNAIGQEEQDDQPESSDPEALEAPAPEMDDASEANNRETTDPPEGTHSSL